MSEVSTVQWGIRFGDGVIEESISREQAEGELDFARRRIAEGHWGADDYEPMTLVRRYVTTLTSEWGEPE